MRAMPSSARSAFACSTSSVSAGSPGTTVAAMAGSYGRRGRGPGSGVVGQDRGVATEDDVRRIALSLPATTERPSYGTPGFRVRDRLFARLHDLPHTLVVWVADMAEKEALLASAPDRFFETPHYDGYPMVLVHLDAIDDAELTEVVTDSWRA